VGNQKFFFFGLWFIFWIGKLKFYVLYVFNQLAAFIACVERWGLRVGSLIFYDFLLEL
jgi:hypothetical protein